jgi:DNA polymerase elongation subunit (family B)
MSSEYYTNVALLGRHILFRGIQNGKRVQRKIEYSPTFYIPSSENSEFKTLDNKPVKPIKPGNILECREFIQRYEGVDNFPIFGNTRYEYAYIADSFPDDILWDVNKILVAYIDIEVASEFGFPEPRLANEQITAITIKLKDNYFVFGVGDYNKLRDDVHYAKCDNELQLIKRFLEFWCRFHPDVVTGWNIKTFDIPYLVNRITNLLGEDEAKKLSPWKKLSVREIMIFNRKQQVYDIYGICTLDYLELYRKFSYSQQESYRLDHIASVELGETKLDYSEYETLHQLYKLDYDKFIRYNIKDVELVYRLEDKMKLIEQALTLAYDNKVNYDDVFTQVRMWDAIVYNELKSKNIVIPQIKRGDKTEAYEGAYVKDPILGLHKWVVSFDLNSLYPHLIMQYNISMETLQERSLLDEEVIQFLSENEINVENVLNQSLDLQILKKHNLTMTPNAQLYKKGVLGVMPEIMQKMYNDRTRYKKLAIEAKKKLEANKEDKVQTEFLIKQIARYNNLQMAKKVTLNSAYGAMGNQYFRFYDTRLATSITTAGQLSIRWIENEINAFMNKLLKTNEVDYVIASDTDSIYINLESIVNKVYAEGADTKKIIKFMDEVCKQKIQPFIDKSYETLAEYVNAYSQRMEMKRESLADKAIWTAKKRYILNVHDNEGIVYEKPKLKIMGLEAIKSSTPSACRAKIKEAISIMLTKDEEYLQNFIEEFREEFKQIAVEEISFPRSVNGLSKYADGSNIYKKGTPIHVKGALVYNNLLVSMKLDKKYQLIQEGEKIKFVYLKDPNPFNNNTLAFTSTLPKQLKAESWIDYDAQFKTAFLDPVETILKCLNWSAVKTSSLEGFFA